MPRHPRIDMVGYYHIVNRSVDKRVVFKDDADFKRYLELLCDASKIYGVKVHAYVMMNNHYHLLIETTKENLSKFMKYINGAIHIKTLIKKYLYVYFYISMPTILLPLSLE